MQELRSRRLIYTKVETECKNSYFRVREIKKILNEYEIIEKFDKELFKALVQKIRVTSEIEVEFILKTGIEVRQTVL